MDLLKNNRKVRFLATGSVITAIDFGALFVFRSFGLPVEIANIFSTTVAFICSFFANKKYTFKATGANLKREIVLFTVVTLFGIWVLQTIVISGIMGLLSGINLNEPTKLIVAKLMATVVSMTWNYIMYSRVVFKKKDS